MEVHHHAHTERKKWHHYFWEFFMLFLAVTLGFFVENQREHLLEKKRARVFAASMLSNLKNDSAELQQIVYRGLIAQNNLDTFMSLVSSQSFTSIPTGKLYWYGMWGSYLRGFEPDDATFQQMKSSGSLRYFDNSELEDKITSYDQVVRRMATLNEIDQTISFEVKKARAKLFDFRINNKAGNIIQQYVFTNYNQAAIDSFIKLNPPLLSTDRIQFNEYAELCRLRNLRQQLKNTSQAFYLAIDIIKSLKQEFNLE